MKNIKMLIIGIFISVSSYADIGNVPTDNIYNVFNSTIVQEKPIKAIMVNVYKIENIKELKDKNEKEVQKQEKTNKIIKQGQMILSKNNIIEYSCNNSFCVIVDHTLNKYIFDQNNINAYNFLTGN